MDSLEAQYASSFARVVLERRSRRSTTELQTDQGTTHSQYALLFANAFATENHGSVPQRSQIPTDLYGQTSTNLTLSQGKDGFTSTLPTTSHKFAPLNANHMTHHVSWDRPHLAESMDDSRMKRASRPKLSPLPNLLQKNANKRPTVRWNADVANHSLSRKDASSHVTDKSDRGSQAAAVDDDYGTPKHHQGNIQANVGNAGSKDADKSTTQRDMPSRNVGSVQRVRQHDTHGDSESGQNNMEGVSSPYAGFVQARPGDTDDLSFVIGTEQWLHLISAPCFFVST
jgi:hypothetical protein